MTDDQLATLLRAGVAPPPADLTARVLAAAAPLLAANAARRPDWALVARALVAAVLCLPMTLAIDAALVRGLYHVLDLVLPSAVSLWVSLQYALILLLLVGTTLAAIPVLAGRTPLGWEDVDV